MGGGRGSGKRGRGSRREKDAQGRDEYRAKGGWTSSTFLNVRCRAALDNQYALSSVTLDLLLLMANHTFRNRDSFVNTEQEVNILVHDSTGEHSLLLLTELCHYC